MDPCRDNNRLLGLHSLEVALLSDGQDIAVIASKCLAHGLPGANGPPGRVTLNCVDVVHQVCVGVGQRVSKVDRVVIMLELVTEAQRVELSRIVLNGVLLDAIGEVADAFAAFVPPSPCLVILGRHGLGVDGDLHAKVKETVRLGEVHDVELDGASFARVFDLEEEPLRMPARVDVVLHQAVVLSVRHLLGKVQVATFEARLEKERVVLSVDLAGLVGAQLVVGLFLEYLVVLFLLLGLWHLLGWLDPEAAAVSRFIRGHQRLNVE